VEVIDLNGKEAFAAIDTDYTLDVSPLTYKTKPCSKNEQGFLLLTTLQIFSLFRQSILKAVSDRN
jgi:hypothetical protein